ncbi:MAG: 2-oxoacid:acceptor oxidoreductase subunit alpha [Desulfobacterales bacterium]|nr:2-oxoacid:acceptor oxidoreductase subunit alpha [Desulfobacterales bacterium]
MTLDITVTIGGEAGQGIQTVGEIIALVCKKSGLFVMANNDFESRIRGGHSFFQVRISDKPVRAPHHRIHLLVALNQDAYRFHKDSMASGGLVLMDDPGAAMKKDVVPIPFNELAGKAGGKITANTVAAGACLSVLGAPLKIFKAVLKDLFESKGPEILESNHTAAQLGYEAAAGTRLQWTLARKVKASRGVLINGSKAIALGALAADCRMAAFYPMSPATEIMNQLAGYSDRFPVVVEQAEDEISAANMIIGASFAGVRSMTATSGGGFCLMTEALGLAGMTETPIVIVNAQRPGPATGLPTRTGQADLHFVINASQDEFPRFVFAPGSPAEAFETTRKAFHLAEKYQVPAIVLVDQYLNDSLFIEETAFTAPKTIERFIATDESIGDPARYRRYAVTPSGISPRVAPCMGKALIVCNGNEHAEDGHISENISNRIRMVDKRNAKVPHMVKEMSPPPAYKKNSGTLLVGWGSTRGAIKESVDILRKEGLDVGCLHFTDIWPFPAQAVRRALAKNKKFIAVELNSSAQLGRLIRQETGLSSAGAILKYDGRPFCPNDIAEGFKKLVRS